MRELDERRLRHRNGLLSGETCRIRAADGMNRIPVTRRTRIISSIVAPSGDNGPSTLNGIINPSIGSGLV